MRALGRVLDPYSVHAEPMMDRISDVTQQVYAAQDIRPLPVVHLRLRLWRVLEGMEG